MKTLKEILTIVRERLIFLNKIGGERLYLCWIVDPNNYCVNKYYPLLFTDDEVDLFNNWLWNESDFIRFGSKKYIEVNDAIWNSYNFQNRLDFLDYHLENL